MSGDLLEFEIFTLFPGAIEAFLRAGLIGKALERGVVSVRCTDYRDFTTDRYRTVDDTPYGGGPGMVLKIEPVLAALESVIAERGAMHRVLLTPSAPVFDQRAAQRLAGHRRIALICGRYEGIDDRLREAHVDESLSIGDFVLNGGEVAALAIVEAVARLHDGVIGNPESLARESFAADVFSGAASTGRWLEPPQYTRPPEHRGQRVPDVLLRGNHAEIERWRRDQAWSRTWQIRPELRRVDLRASAEPRPIYLAITGAPSDDPSVDGHDLRAAVGELLARTPKLAGVLLLGDAICSWWGADTNRDISLLATRRGLRRMMRQRHGSNAIVLGLTAAPGDDVPVTSNPEALDDFLRLLDGDGHNRAKRPLLMLLDLRAAKEREGRFWPVADISFIAAEPAPQNPADLTTSTVARAPVIDESSQPRSDRGSLVELVFATLSSILADPESRRTDSGALP
ncbi:MAG: tRNA (guanosine(37)-N1)-methyltransferase TrmD [Myxococcales bacterium]|nr:tRNA (guanosine(37)-N1)-methyltransferase TrmD [Myxococcales bacterium]MCB9750158.1 tRNA (guanosine(37)-N1)-methyltransferase TrmD [Myxococcales bacterium]